MRSPRTSSAPFRFFFNEAATTEIYTLSLHDALPIRPVVEAILEHPLLYNGPRMVKPPVRSEEHTAELQSRVELVCRLLLEKINYYNVFALILFITLNINKNTTYDKYT